MHRFKFFKEHPFFRGDSKEIFVEHFFHLSLSLDMTKGENDQSVKFQPTPLLIYSLTLMYFSNTIYFQIHHFNIQHTR